MATVELKNVRKTFGAEQVIKGVSLRVEDREFVVFVGPSGCGKSTLLRMIAGLEEITEGELFIDGERANDVPPDARGLAMVFQSYALYPHMTVAGNMGFALRLAGVDRAERDRKVHEAARILQLEPLLARKPRELSGGQRQRVAIGRAIVRQPKVFLFDEPLSNLDAALRVQMRLELARLHHHFAATMIYVTHDQVEAMTMADRIVVLNNGLIEQIGAPLELYNTPANLFVAAFIGSPKMNLVKTTVAGRGDGTLGIALPGGASVSVPAAPGNLAAGAPVTLGLRPDHLAFAAEGPLGGTVMVVEHLGGDTYVYVQVADGPVIVVRGPADTPVKVGDAVRLQLRTDQASVFDGDGRALRRPGAGRPLAVHEGAIAT